MYHTVAETALVQQFKLQTDLVREGLRAASHHDGGEELVTLVDQSEPQCLGSKRGTAHREVASRSRFELLDGVRVELTLEPGSCGGYILQALGVDDLVGCLPDLRVLLPADRSRLPVGAVSQ